MGAKIPDWLRQIAEGVGLNSNWPDGKFPYVAFEASAIAAGESATGDAEVALLQCVINEVERLRGAKQELVNAVDILVERSLVDNLNAGQTLVRVRDAIERAFDAAVGNGDE